MAKRDKLLEKMRNNPRGDFNITQIKKLADYYNVQYRQPGTSHVTFYHKEIDLILTVPAHKPIKPIYIKKFVNFIDFAKETENV